MNKHTIQLIIFPSLILLLDSINISRQKRGENTEWEMWHDCFFAKPTVQVSSWSVSN